MKHIKLFEELNPENNQEIIDNDYRIVYRGAWNMFFPMMNTMLVFLV